MYTTGGRIFHTVRQAGKLGGELVINELANMLY